MIGVSMCTWHFEIFARTFVGRKCQKFSVGLNKGDLLWHVVVCTWVAGGVA